MVLGISDLKCSGEKNDRKYLCHASFATEYLQGSCKAVIDTSFLPSFIHVLFYKDPSLPERLTALTCRMGSQGKIVSEREKMSANYAPVFLFPVTDGNHIRQIYAMFFIVSGFLALATHSAPLVNLK